jgi:hypothetical protein
VKFSPITRASSAVVQAAVDKVVYSPGHPLLGYPVTAHLHVYDIERVNGDDFEKFKHILTDIYGCQSAVHFHYLDSDGDEVRVKSVQEWQEFLCDSPDEYRQLDFEADPTAVCAQVSAYERMQEMPAQTHPAPLIDLSLSATTVVTRQPQTQPRTAIIMDQTQMRAIARQELTHHVADLKKEIKNELLRELEQKTLKDKLTAKAEKKKDKEVKKVVKACAKVDSKMAKIAMKAAGVRGTADVTVSEEKQGAWKCAVGFSASAECRCINGRVSNACVTVAVSRQRLLAPVQFVCGGVRRRIVCNYTVSSCVRPLMHTSSVICSGRRQAVSICTECMNARSYRHAVAVRLPLTQVLQPRHISSTVEHVLKAYIDRVRTDVCMHACAKECALTTQVQIGDIDGNAQAQQEQCNP